MKLVGLRTQGRDPFAHSHTTRRPDKTHILSLARGRPYQVTMQTQARAQGPSSNHLAPSFRTSRGVAQECFASISFIVPLLRRPQTRIARNSKIYPYSQSYLYELYIAHESQITPSGFSPSISRAQFLSQSQSLYSNLRAQQS
jgi:hypothetical protein